MGRKDPKVDAYIARAPEFAKPILTHLRGLVHKHCPDVAEELKWSKPHFTYKGMFCGMGAFKEHAVFGFWHPLMRDMEKAAEAMGNYGRMQTLNDLPPDKVIAGHLKAAMKLNDEGIKAPKEKKVAKPPVETPEDLEAALRRNKLAAKAYKDFSESCRREYVEWITEAKREETREKRVAQTVEWLAEGKKRNWKYENC